MLSDGYHDVPLGKVATVVTILEMTKKPKTQPVSAPSGWTLTRVTNPDRLWYRNLFRKIGEEWLWFAREILIDSELDALLQNPMIHVYTLRQGNEDGGLLELDFRVDGTCELAYFGLAAELIGSGAGLYLMNIAIHKAWAEGITRFHLHTCTLDSPKALPFYLQSGFVPIAQKIEIADDPRLQHGYDRSLGKHVPIFDL